MNGTIHRKKIIYPSWQSAKKPISAISLFVLLFIAGGMVCRALSPQGIDFHSMLVIVLIPTGFILIPICLTFFSYRIELTDEEISFYMFFIPVRVVKLNEIEKIQYENLSDRRQPCVLTVLYPGARYSYPVKLFDRNEIDLIILSISDGMNQD